MLTMLLILASITFFSMMSPGPDMMLLIRYSSSRSPWPAVACIAGINCGLSVHVALAILSISAVIVASATLYTAAKFAGAAYLVYIGLKSLFADGGMALSNDPAQPLQRTAAAAFRDGLMCNLLNPKVTIFILAVFTQVVDPSTAVIDKVIFGIFIVAESFIVWNLFVRLVRTRLVLGFLQRHQRAINAVVGVFLVGFGVALMLDQNI